MNQLLICKGVSGSEKSNGIDDPNQSKPKKKTEFYGSDQKPNQTNRKPKWFGSVLGSNFSDPMDKLNQTNI
jgi:hypothetical protein